MRQAHRGIRILAGVICLVWSCMNLVLAQTQPMTTVQEILKNIKPSSCSRKDIKKPIPSEYVRVAEVKPDLSCVINPADLAHKLKSPGTVLVDTRSAMDFAEFHIEGAMNISATELRSKSFLRDKSVVLIGNGKAERELYIECRRLKSTGFRRVNVLRGGMPAWLASGHGVLGQSPNLARLTTLTPSELWTESRFEANLVLVTASQKTLQKQITGSLLIPDERPKTVQAIVKQQRSRHSKSGSRAAVVLVA
ncbi:MAG: rhodanese-like domain-containing protein, partial [Methylobacter sp.]